MINDNEIENLSHEREKERETYCLSRPMNRLEIVPLEDASVQIIKG